MIVLNHGTLNRQTEKHNIITVLARELGYEEMSGGHDKMLSTSPNAPDGVYVTNGVGSAELDLDLWRMEQYESRDSRLNLLHPGVKDGAEVEKNVEDYV